MSRFEYKPIDLEECSFRLLRLFHGDHGCIRCELFDAWLRDTDGSMEYEALSYTWGGTAKPHDIEINGRMMPVTKNLSLALQHLRYPYEDRILWADAICIDQENDKERAHQVVQMTSIYKRAERVLIWLGQATSETDLAFHYMQSLEKEAFNYACNNWTTSDERWQALWSTVQQPLDNVHENWMHRLHEGLWILFGRSWFKRVWIIQEVANARSAKVICGTKSVSARIFAIIPSLVGITPDPHCQAILDIMPGPTRKHSWWSQNNDLRTLLLKFRGSKATESRDVIYALLGISSDGCDTDILVPNYEKSVEEVIHDTIAFLLHLHDGKGCTPCLPQWTMPEFLRNLDSLEHAVLIWAVLNRHEALVKLLLDTGKVDVNSKDQSAQTPLSCAAEFGCEAIVKLLLATGKPNTESKNQTGWMPLWIAALNGHEAVVELLLDSTGEDENERTLTCATALSRDKNLANMLLETGKIDVNLEGRYGQTPLLWATENGHEAVAELLLETGKVDVDSKSEKERTPLWWAAWNGHEAVVKLLLDTGKINVDSKDCYGRTPLSRAARNGHEAVVKLLLDMDKVDVDSKDQGERTPLSVAARNGHEAVVKLLLDTGKVDVDSKYGYGRTPLSGAACYGHEAVVKLLLDTGKVDVDSKDQNERTPLWWAAWSGHEAVMKLLLDTGKINVDSKDRYGRTPLSRAARNGHEAVVKLLLDMGKVDVDSKDQSERTLLWWAACYGHDAVVKLLLNTDKVDVDSKDCYGQTPLSQAARNGHEAVAKLLLNTGKVDVNLKDQNGQTPLSWAARYGHEAIVELLQ